MLRIYAFGLEEHTYSGDGSTNQANTYFYLTDALGSILASINNPAGGAVIKENQVFGPYGNVSYHAGTLNTAKGFIGQYNDQLTGLDYFNARYYDPVVGMFLSADKTQGNPQGMDPYGYVGGNPETYTDPTGNAYINNGGGTYVSPQQQQQYDYHYR